jgi:phosphoglycerol transferase MdoB-like AlkP superfamily enzyme
VAAAARRVIALIAALVLLDVSLTFENIWPTPAVRWAGGISVELAVCVLGMIVAARWPGGLTRRALVWLSALWLLLVLGRYVEVTTPALYGRDVNLYWDLRFIPDVAAMVIRVAPVWTIALALVTVVLVIVLLHRLALWSLTRVNDAIQVPLLRGALAMLASLAIVLFVTQRILSKTAENSWFPTPVVETYAHQAALLADAVGASRTLPPSPSMASSFARVQGADVFLVFVESYGAVTYEGALADRLAPARRRLQADVDATGRAAVSAAVRSPTFGGSSWLAHVTLMSGIEVREPHTNAVLMAEQRDTIVKAFARGGFRTIALMPGLRRFWPEGAFYGFDELYGADRLAYRGPEFGWFAIPDQFSLARFDDLERNRASRPRFVVFPTISTHFPFSPTPPYQPDWSRMLDAKPYDGPAIVRAYARQPDWTDFTPGYVDAMTYDLEVLGGYLRRHSDDDLVMMLVGDHQPPAAVSGHGASWNVPVHVIASRRPLLDRLLARGFRAGLEPDRTTLAPMHELLPILLDAFGGDR